MSLKILVAFAQQNFGSSSGLPGSGSAARDQPEGLMLPPRPPVPDWLQQPSAQQEVPFDAEHPWKIEGRVEPPPPPENVDQLGADALAFYLPFHFYRERWGIYLRSSGVLYLASVLKGDALIPGDEPYLNLADLILMEHEWFHAATEIAATRAEVIARRSLYRPYFGDSRAAEHEEALANAQAILWAFRDDPLRVRPKVEAWMRRQGPGYRDYDRWTSGRAFTSGVEQEARFLTNGLPPPQPRADSSLHTFLFRGARRYKMPTSRIHDLGRTSVSVLRPFPKAYGMQVVVHTNDHPPPHIHIFVPPGGHETRYKWPELQPLKGDSPLPRSAEKALRRYLDAYGDEIREKLNSVYAQRAA